MAANVNLLASRANANLTTRFSFVTTSLLNENMKALKTEIIINASAVQVWRTLMDFKNYHHWNPFITDISGQQEVGSILLVKIQPEGKKPMTFKPIVLKNDPEKEFRWLGHLFIKGLFDGEHYFKIKPIALGKTTFIHGEIFKGVMASALLKMIGESTLAGFKSMNEALKKRVETIDTKIKLS